MSELRACSLSAISFTLPPLFASLRLLLSSIFSSLLYQIRNSGKNRDSFWLLLKRNNNALINMNSGEEWSNSSQKGDPHNLEEEG